MLGFRTKVNWDGNPTRDAEPDGRDGFFCSVRGWGSKIPQLPPSLKRRVNIRRGRQKKEYAQREVEQNGHFLDREVTKSLDGTKPSHRQRFARRGKAGLQVKTAVGEAKVNQRSRKLEGGDHPWMHVVREVRTLG
ncbi:hypothetical protein CDAR_550911 [Caerostris darwini]|uniref:Uncharacterized protein n=1 Tax=Caerostris darwini TaxID=1538125 RepID=A0AAV4QR83_9ARAC|nr:hypothetical protein CDAR_550911 [Caerostris darwini]